jgi:TPR repeat protein
MPVRQNGDGASGGQSLFALTKSAEQGDANAQYTLGRMYLGGDGVEKNCPLALAWFQKSADQGFAGAQGALGIMYANAICVVQNDNKAASWYRKAADQHDAVSEFGLGEMYMQGQGVPRDYRAAMMWLRRGLNEPMPPGDAAKFNAVKRGGLFDIGLMYELGAGVPKDVREAISWYQKAGDLGNADAQARIAQLQKARITAGGPLKLLCRGAKGNAVVSIDAATQSVTVEGGLTIEYHDNDKQYVTITDDAVEFGCRKTTTEAEKSATILGTCSAPENQIQIRSRCATR